LKKNIVIDTLKHSQQPVSILRTDLSTGKCLKFRESKEEGNNYQLRFINW